MAIEATIPAVWLAVTAVLVILLGVFLGYIAREDSLEESVWTPMDAGHEDLPGGVRPRRKPLQQAKSSGEIGGQDHALTCIPVDAVKDASGGNLPGENPQKRHGRSQSPHQPEAEKILSSAKAS